MHGGSGNTAAVAYRGLSTLTEIYTHMFVCSELYICFDFSLEATAKCVQGLLMSLHSGIIPGSAPEETYKSLRI